MPQRFFIPHQTGYAVGQHIEVPPEMVRQMRQVLRLQVGSSVVVLDDRGWEYEVVLESLHRGGGQAQVQSLRQNGNEPRLHLTLFMSLLKRDNFEWVLQKGTELGVSRFVPVVTQRTVVTAVKPNKAARWQRILQEAAEQCRRGRLPQLLPEVDWETAVAQAQAANVALIPWEEATTGSIAANVPASAGSVALLIGPEGGFTVDEVEQATAAGIQPVSLGRRILRAETAAVAAATLVMAQAGEMEGDG